MRSFRRKGSRTSVGMVLRINWNLRAVFVTRRGVRCWLECPVDGKTWKKRRVETRGAAYSTIAFSFEVGLGWHGREMSFRDDRSRIMNEIPGYARHSFRSRPTTRSSISRCIYPRAAPVSCSRTFSTEELPNRGPRCPNTANRNNTRASRIKYSPIGSQLFKETVLPFHRSSSRLPFQGEIDR